MKMFCWSIINLIWVILQLQKSKFISKKSLIRIKEIFKMKIEGSMRFLISNNHQQPCMILSQILTWFILTSWTLSNKRLRHNSSRFQWVQMQLSLYQVGLILSISILLSNMTRKENTKMFLEELGKSITVRKVNMSNQLLLLILKWESIKWLFSNLNPRIYNSNLFNHP